MPNSPSQRNPARKKVYDRAAERLPELKQRIKRNIQAKMKETGSSIRKRAIEADFPPKAVDGLINGRGAITLKTLLVLSIVFGVAPEKLLRKPKVP